MSELDNGFGKTENRKEGSNPIVDCL